MTPVQETFTEALEFTSEFTPRSFLNLLKHLEPTWVEEALMSTGTATICRRRVPAEQTVWLLLGMALMRDLPITEARQLDIALPARDGTRTVASSALTQAWTDPPRSPRRFARGFLRFLASQPVLNKPQHQSRRTADRDVRGIDRPGISPSQRRLRGTDDRLRGTGRFSTKADIETSRHRVQKT